MQNNKRFIEQYWHSSTKAEDILLQGIYSIVHYKLENRASYFLNGTTPWEILSQEVSSGSITAVAGSSQTQLYNAWQYKNLSLKVLWMLQPLGPFKQFKSLLWFIFYYFSKNIKKWELNSSLIGDICDT